MPRSARPIAVTATAVTAAACLALGMSTVTAGPADSAPLNRQQAFTFAAEEFDVPESILLGVSFLESRWNANGGAPSTAAGYGPMHLTDVVAANSGSSHHDEGSEDPRGDTARSVLHPEPGQFDVSSPSLHTLELAAGLTEVEAEKLRSDPVQNIRGGAALLAHYQDELGVASDAPADWYGAVARYSGASDTGAAAAFADEVFATITEGVQRVTDDGHLVRLDPHPGLTPNTAQLDRLGLRQTDRAETECPRSLACEWIPAPYEEFGDGDYGNHDKANRPRSQKIKYIVIHDTEATWDTTLRLVQDPTYVSWQYSLRSADGHIAQHVKAKDVAWQAGNWYVNSKSIGLEHEGFAAEGTWYTEAMYRTSAKLVRYLTRKYDIPLDRAHIIGHDNVPGITPDHVAGMHWDPGPYWDWAHYFELLGAPFEGAGRPVTGMVTILPDYDTNKPAFTGCEEAGEPCPPRGSTSVILHTRPRANAPLLTDIGLHPDGSPSTMHISDHGSRVETGQTYAVAGQRGDWTAIWYLGQKGWFHNPRSNPTAVWTHGLVAMPKPGRDSIPVYGRPYPEASAYPEHIPPQDIVPLQYSWPAGQRYSVGLVARSEYYWATTFDPSNHTVVRGDLRYVQVQFGHRMMFVKADDVVLRPAR